MQDVGARAIGARVLRAEDPRILTGRGRYVDDVVLPGMLHAAFKRSTVPHGRLVSVDVTGGAGAAGCGRGLHRRRPRTVHECRRLPGGVDRHEHDARAQGARGLRARDRQGALRRRPDRAGRRRRPLHRRGRGRAHRRRHRRARRRSSPTRTRSTGRSRRCSTSSTTTSRCSSEMAIGDVDGAFAKADRIVRGEHLGAPPPAGADGVPRTHRVVRPSRPSTSRSTRRRSRRTCCGCFCRRRSTSRWRTSACSPTTSAAGSA